MNLVFLRFVLWVRARNRRFVQTSHGGTKHPVFWSAMNLGCVRIAVFAHVLFSFGFFSYFLSRGILVITLKVLSRLKWNPASSLYYQIFFLFFFVFFKVVCSKRNDCVLLFRLIKTKQNKKRVKWLFDL